MIETEKDHESTTGTPPVEIEKDIHGVPYAYGNRRTRRASMKHNHQSGKQMHLDKRQVAMLFLSKR